MPDLNAKQIMEIIPHRFPFLLIDRVIELEAGKKCIAIKNVTMNEPFFPGHFPQMPVMPGVLIIEAMAQAGAVAILSLDDYKGKLAFFGGIDKAKFRGMVVPGDTLRLEVELLKLRGPGGIGAGKAYVGEKKVAEAEFTFMVG